MQLMSRRSVSKAKPYLLLHCNGADSGTTITDSGPEGHAFTAYNNAQTDTDQSKFRGSSLLLDSGQDDYVRSNSTDSGFNLSTNTSVDFFTRLANTTEYFHFCGYGSAAGATDFWRIHKSSAGDNTAVKFELFESSAAVVSMAGGVFSATTWHHVALCKIGNEYGLYLDGSQVAHTSDSDSISTTDYFYVGRSASSLNGHIAEIRMVHGNPFNANPVSGLTDKIQVPQQPYPSWS